MKVSKVSKSKLYLMKQNMPYITAVFSSFPWHSQFLQKQSSGFEFMTLKIHKAILHRLFLHLGFTATADHHLT